MLNNKRRLSAHYSSILSGEGFDERERGESLLYTCINWFVLVLPNSLNLRSKMVPVKPVETLHGHLRRHFEKVSKRKARQFAEQTEAPKVDGASRYAFPQTPEARSKRT
jgi:hypothetical protein